VDFLAPNDTCARIAGLAHQEPYQSVDTSLDFPIQHSESRACLPYLCPQVRLGYFASAETSKDRNKLTEVFHFPP